MADDDKNLEIIKCFDKILLLSGGKVSLTDVLDKFRVTGIPYEQQKQLAMMVTEEISASVGEAVTKWATSMHTILSDPAKVAKLVKNIS